MENRTTPFAFFFGLGVLDVSFILEEASTLPSDVVFLWSHRSHELR